MGPFQDKKVKENVSSFFLSFCFIEFLGDNTQPKNYLKSLKDFVLAEAVTVSYSD